MQEIRIFRFNFVTVGPSFSYVIKSCREETLQMPDNLGFTQNNSLVTKINCTALPEKVRPLTALMILGNGPDNIYEKEMEALYNAIVAGHRVGGQFT